MLPILKPPDSNFSKILKSFASEGDNILNAFLEPEKKAKEETAYEKLGIPKEVVNIRDPATRKDIVSQYAKSTLENKQLDFSGGENGYETFKNMSQADKAKLAQVKPKLYQSLQQQEESEILSRYNKDEIPLEERKKLTPSTLKTLANLEKPVYEAEADKLAAKSAAEYADKVKKDFNVWQTEDLRLKEQKRLSDTDKLSTPAMVKFMDRLGVPLSVLGNPQNELYDKVTADYVRDVSSVFPGQIRVFEIESYLKTVPTLLNSKEGKQLIIENRQLMNEARRLKYDAFKDIMKGRTSPPPDIELQVNERVGPQLNEVYEKYLNNIQDSMDNFGPTVPMINDKGEIADIPIYGIEATQKAGWKIYNE